MYIYIYLETLYIYVKRMYTCVFFKHVWYVTIPCKIQIYHFRFEEPGSFLHRKKSPKTAPPGLVRDARPGGNKEERKRRRGNHPTHT